MMGPSWANKTDKHLVDLFLQICFPTNKTGLFSTITGLPSSSIIVVNTKLFRVGIQTCVIILLSVPPVTD